MRKLTNRRSLLFIAAAGIAALSLAACQQGEGDKQVTPAAAMPAPTEVTDWMSWEGGVDLVAVTDPTLTQPNVIVHLARMVHTPVGSAPSGMILYQPDPKGAPVVIGFVSTDAKVGAYFGPKIFAGTPFESAPVLDAKITTTDGPGTATSKVEAGGHVFEVTLDNLGALTSVQRGVGNPMPFVQNALESSASKVTLKVDGKEAAITVPTVGLSGGAAAVWSPAGIYAR